MTNRGTGKTTRAVLLSLLSLSEGKKTLVLSYNQQVARTCYKSVLACADALNLDLILASSSQSLKIESKYGGYVLFSTPENKSALVGVEYDMVLIDSVTPTPEILERLAPICSDIRTQF